MRKYIDSEAFFKVINTLPYKDTSYPDASVYNGAISDVADMLTHFPAADVVKVRHGEWVFKFYCGNMSGYDYGMTCSVCGKPTHRQFAEKMPPYCPNCGASMMGEKEAPDPPQEAYYNKGLLRWKMKDEVEE